VFGGGGGGGGGGVWRRWDPVKQVAQMRAEIYSRQGTGAPASNKAPAYLDDMLIVTSSI
jgi:hypothetical protein